MLFKFCATESGLIFSMEAARRILACSNVTDTHLFCGGGSVGQPPTLAIKHPRGVAVFELASALPEYPYTSDSAVVIGFRNTPIAHDTAQLILTDTKLGAMLRQSKHGNGLILEIYGQAAPIQVSAITDTHYHSQGAPDAGFNALSPELQQLLLKVMNIPKIQFGDKVYTRSI